MITLNIITTLIVHNSQNKRHRYVLWNTITEKTKFALREKRWTSVSNIGMFHLGDIE